MSFKDKVRAAAVAVSKANEDMADSVFLAFRNRKGSWWKFLVFVGVVFLAGVVVGNLA